MRYAIPVRARRRGIRRRLRGLRPRRTGRRHRARARRRRPRLRRDAPRALRRREDVDLRQPAARLLPGGLRLPARLGLASARPARRAPLRDLLLGLVRLPARARPDEPPLLAREHGRRDAAGRELRFHGVLRPDRRRRAPRARAVRRAAPLGRGRHGPDGQRAPRRDGRRGAGPRPRPGDRRARRATHGRRAGLERQRADRLPVRRRAILRLHAPALRRRATRPGTRARDGVLRRGRRQPHLSALRPRLLGAPRVRRVRPAAPDPALFPLEPGEAAFRTEIARRPPIAARAALFDSIATVEAGLTRIGGRIYAFLSSPSFGSSTLARASLAVQYTDARAAGAPPERLKEIAERAAAIGNRPAALERLLAAAQFQDLKRALGERDTLAAALFAGRTADQAAADLLSHTALSDSARVPALFQGDLAASGDAAFLFARRASRVVVPLRQEAARLSARADNLATRLARVRFDVYGKTLPPDATFTLRLPGGAGRGYPDHRTPAGPLYTV